MQGGAEQLERQAVRVGRALTPNESQGGRVRAVWEAKLSDRVPGPQHGSALASQHPAETQSHTTPRQANDQPPNPRALLTEKQGKMYLEPLCATPLGQTLHFVKKQPGIQVSHKHGHINLCPNTCIRTITRGFSLHDFK